MSMLVHNLRVGSYFLQYFNANVQMEESLNRVTEIIKEDDGTVIAKFFSIRKGSYSTLSFAFKAIQSDQNEVKISLISQHQAEMWMTQHKKKTFESPVINQTNVLQYIVGEEQNILEHK